MSLEDRLQWVGSRRRQVEQMRSEVSAELAKAVRDAAKAEIPKTRIAELAGVSRQTIHEMLKGS